MGSHDGGKQSATVGATTLEVRYTRACGTAWGRITGGAPGDKVRFSVGGRRHHRRR